MMRWMFGGNLKQIDHALPNTMLLQCQSMMLNVQIYKYKFKYKYKYKYATQYNAPTKSQHDADCTAQSIAPCSILVHRITLDRITLHKTWLCKVGCLEFWAHCWKWNCSAHCCAVHNVHTVVHTEHNDVRTELHIVTIFTARQRTLAATAAQQCILKPLSLASRSL